MGQIGVQMKAFIKYNKNILKLNNTGPEVRPEVARNKPNHAIKVANEHPNESSY